MLLRIPGIWGDDVVSAVNIDGCGIAAKHVELVNPAVVLLGEQYAEKIF